MDLLWLSRLTDEPKYDTMAAQMTKTFAQEIEGAPEATLSSFQHLAF